MTMGLADGLPADPDRTRFSLVEREARQRAIDTQAFPSIAFCSCRRRR